MADVSGETAGALSVVGVFIGGLAKSLMERRSADEKRLDEREQRLWDQMKETQAEALRVRDERIAEQDRQIDGLRREIDDLRQRLGLGPAGR